MKNLKNKNSDWYKYYANDFSINRKIHFFSIFYQAREVILNPEIKTMLEFGTGRNLTKAIVEHYGIKHKSVDFDNERFFPDEVSTILDYNDKKKYDVVAAFQVLEHNPIEKLESHLLKMKKLTNKYMYISLPFSGRWISFSFFFNLFPKIAFQKNVNFNWERKIFKKVRPIETLIKRKDKYNAHWWEIGDKNLSKNQFKKLLKKNNINIVKSFHNDYNPYHIFYLLEIDS